MAVAPNNRPAAAGVVYTDNALCGVSETVSRLVTYNKPNPALRTKSQNVATRNFRYLAEDGNDYTLHRADKTVQIRN